MLFLTILFYVILLTLTVLTAEREGYITLLVISFIIIRNNFLTFFHRLKYIFHILQNISSLGYFILECSQPIWIYCINNTLKSNTISISSFRLHVLFIYLTRTKYFSYSFKQKSIYRNRFFSPCRIYS